MNNIDHIIGRHQEIVKAVNNLFVSEEEILPIEELQKGNEVYDEEGINKYFMDIEKAMREGADPEELLGKARKDYSKLVKRKVWISRGGKRFEKTVYVKPFTNKEKKQADMKEGDSFKDWTGKKKKVDAVSGNRVLTDDGTTTTKKKIAEDKKYLDDQAGNGKKKKDNVDIAVGKMKDKFNERKDTSLSGKGDFLDIDVSTKKWADNRKNGFSVDAKYTSPTTGKRNSYFLYFNKDGSYRDILGSPATNSVDIRKLGESLKGKKYDELVAGGVSVDTKKHPPMGISKNKDGSYTLGDSSDLSLVGVWDYDEPYKEFIGEFYDDGDGTDGETVPTEAEYNILKEIDKKVKKVKAFDHRDEEEKSLFLHKNLSKYDIYNAGAGSDMNICMCFPKGTVINGADKYSEEDVDMEFIPLSKEAKQAIKDMDSARIKRGKKKEDANKKINPVSEAEANTAFAKFKKDGTIPNKKNVKLVYVPEQGDPEEQYWLIEGADAVEEEVSLWMVHGKYTDYTFAIETGEGDLVDGIKKK